MALCLSSARDGGGTRSRQLECRRPNSREETPKEGTDDISAGGEQCSGDLAANYSYLLILYDLWRLIRRSAISSSLHLSPHTFSGMSEAVRCKGIDAKTGYPLHFNHKLLQTHSPYFVARSS
jgi:hypothetical protein